MKTCWLDPWRFQRRMKPQVERLPFSAFALVPRVPPTPGSATPRSRSPSGLALAVVYWLPQRPGLSTLSLVIEVVLKYSSMPTSVISSRPGDQSAPS